MRILVSNDDGYLAPGIAALADAMRPLGEVTVVAPEQNSSGASNSLTLNRPLTVWQAPGGATVVNGTPSDCVHVALTGLLEHRPDLIVSGINNGQNMGDDTIYSGTVAAAMEGVSVRHSGDRVLAGGQGQRPSRQRGARGRRHRHALSPALDYRALPAERQHSQPPVLRNQGRAVHAARQAASVGAGGEDAEPARRADLLDRRGRSRARRRARHRLPRRPPPVTCRSRPCRST